MSMARAAMSTHASTTDAGEADADPAAAPAAAPAPPRQRTPASGHSAAESLRRPGADTLSRTGTARRPGAATPPAGGAGPHPAGGLLPRRSSHAAGERLLAPAHGRGRRAVPMSATLAANETLARKRDAGEPVLPLAFGEAGLPAHPALRAALAAASGGNAYGPVAGLPVLREAAAGYWTRRGLPTGADAVVSGPGSKPLLFALLLAIGDDVAVPRPSWVSYAAQAAMIGVRTHFVPAAPGEGGVPDPALLARAVVDARAAGRRVGSVVVTLPDNPTGRLATPQTVRALTEVAAEHDLVIISDEIYRDLVHDPAQPFASPSAAAPERTVVTTALSKSLALGGWRVGVARLPDGPGGRELRDRLLGIGSEIWSATALPIQEAAALAFREPPEVAERVARSRALHAAVARAAAGVFAAAGVRVDPPQAAFYLYPDFTPWREHLAERYQVTDDAQLARLLLDSRGMGVLPGSSFGDDPAALRARVATGTLYGDSVAQREAALAAADPLTLPWIAASLDRIAEVLASLMP